MICRGFIQEQSKRIRKSRSRVRHSCTFFVSRRCCCWICLYCVRLRLPGLFLIARHWGGLGGCCSSAISRGSDAGGHQAITNGNWLEKSSSLSRLSTSVCAFGSLSGIFSRCSARPFLVRRSLWRFINSVMLRKLHRYVCLHQRWGGREPFTSGGSPSWRQKFPCRCLRRPPSQCPSFESRRLGRTRTPLVSFKTAGLDCVCTTCIDAG